MKNIRILGVRIDKITEGEVLDLINSWLKMRKKRVVVTPNIEFVMTAQKDAEFRRILHKSDLSIPDSGRFGWSEAIMRETNPVKKLLLWPLFPISKILFKEFPTVTGTDLMEKLCSLSSDWGSTISFLGGRQGVAEKAAECLKKKYPGLKVGFANDGGEIDEDGKIIDGKDTSLKTNILNLKSDILFVAFGHGKQEKWIEKNKNKVDAKVFMGVGGAFDYFSGTVKRAPRSIRALGLEWLYRLIQEPWRIKRFGSLVIYTFKILG